MASNLDRSLDEILDDKKKAARRNKNVKKPAPSGGIKKQRASTRIQQQQQQKKVVETKKETKNDTKIQVSNLPLDVTEQMLREYFSSVVGAIKKCNISYNAAGKSTGIAQLEFVKPGAANNAFEQFNGRLVDSRPMKVEIIVDPGKVPFAARVGAAPKPKVAPKAVPKPAAGKPKPVTANGKAGPAGARGGRKGGRGGRAGSGAKRAPKTVEQLDQEMADYYKGNENAAPAAAAPPTAAQASAMEDL